MKAAAHRSTRDAALDPARTPGEAARLHAVARRGVAGGGAAFPYSSRIREAFGRYAPSSLSAHFGPAARQAASDLSASAFVWNGKAAFAASPDLHTAAHEAAHLVGHARGSRLRDGVGAVGDAGERLADRAADAVAGGRSAEPVFDGAFGTASGEAPAMAQPSGLQMKNVIAAEKHTTPKSPWVEVGEQLKLSKTGYTKFMLGLRSNNRFNAMITALGNTCDRSEWVKASIDTAHSGGDRPANAMQTAYGALGTFMTELTGTATPGEQRRKEMTEFEGGHLISDKILGDDSYEEYNFAPQRRQLNSPIYRKIEEIAEDGTVKKDPSVTKSRPAWSMTAEVTYPTGTLDLDAAAVMGRFNLTNGDLASKPPKTLKLTHRVPWLWKAKIDSGSTDYVFARESAVSTKGDDPTKRRGAAFGFVGDEAEVLKQGKHTLSTIDAVFWGMDSLSFGHPGSQFTRTTGSGLDRSSQHSFTAVQSVPVGQTASMNPLSTTRAPPKPPTIPLLTTPLDIDDLLEVTSGNTAKRKADELYKSEAKVMRRASFTKTALSTALFTASKQLTEAIQTDQKLDIVTATKRVRTAKGGGKPEDRVHALTFINENFRTKQNKPLFSWKPKKKIVKKPVKKKGNK